MSLGPSDYQMYLTISPFEPIIDSHVTIKLAYLVGTTSAHRVGKMQAFSLRKCFILPSFCQQSSTPKEAKFSSLDVRKCIYSNALKAPNLWNIFMLYLFFSTNLTQKAKYLKYSLQDGSLQVLRWPTLQQENAVLYTSQLVPQDLSPHPGPKGGKSAT